MNKLSIVIPAHNEEDCIEETIHAFHSALEKENINHEIIVVNDNSKDRTEEILQKTSQKIHQLRYFNKGPPNGFGLAVRKGLENFQGDCVAIVMADLSDSPADLVRYYRIFQEGYDCSFGSRFIKGSRV